MPLSNATVLIVHIFQIILPAAGWRFVKTQEMGMSGGVPCCIGVGQSDDTAPLSRRFRTPSAMVLKSGSIGTVQPQKTQSALNLPAGLELPWDLSRRVAKSGKGEGSLGFLLKLLPPLPHPGQVADNVWMMDGTLTCRLTNIIDL